MTLAHHQQSTPAPRSSDAGAKHLPPTDPAIRAGLARSLKAALAARGLSARELARRLGCSSTLVDGWVDGTRALPAEKLRDAARDVFELWALDAANEARGAALPVTDPLVAALALTREVGDVSAAALGMLDGADEAELDRAEREAAQVIERAAAFQRLVRERRAALRSSAL